MVIKSRERVQKFGEVFTPRWMVKRMLALPEIQILLQDLHTKFIDPCAGEGAFLTEILREKLNFNPYQPLEVLRSIYGVEIQLDNLAYVRKNLAEIIAAHCHTDLEDSRIWQILNQNIIHGDALKLFQPPPKVEEMNLFEGFYMTDTTLTKFFAEMCGLTDEQVKNAVIITNPPYQEDRKGDNKNYSAPVYHKFVEAFHKTSDRVMILHPARCLFNAGATPKDFNQKLLNDEHVTVPIYEPDGSKVFPNAGVDIKGGVAVTYRDANKNFGKIGTFIPLPELQSIHKKVVVDNKNFQPLSKIMHGQMTYKLSDKAYADFPDLPKRLPRRTDTALRTNAFEIMPDIFLENKPNDGHEYFKIEGLIQNKRTSRFVRQDYMIDIPELHHYKVFIPAANGSGSLNEKLSTPLVGLPLVGSTQTFISVGDFHSEAEAVACMKFIKTKFARALLGILKVTQHNPPEKWKFVPLQDFSADSDIDWSRSIDRIDLLLYQKYALTYDEIKFIETHVKPME